MHPFVYSLTSYYHIREQQDIFGPQLWLPGCLATVFSQLYPSLHVMRSTYPVEILNSFFISAVLHSTLL